jgi:hypothetical protein
VCIYAIENLFQGGCIAEELQRVEWHDNQCEVSTEFEATAVGFNPGKLETLFVRLALGFFKHGAGNVDASDVNARSGQWDRHPPRATADLHDWP